MKSIKSFVCACCLLLLHTTINAQTSIACSPHILGYWIEATDPFSAALLGSKIFHFMGEGKMEIFLYNHETGETTLFGEGKFGFDDLDRPTKIIFYDLTVMIFQTNERIEFPISTFTDDVLEYETFLGIVAHLDKLPDSCEFSVFDEAEEQESFDMGGFSINGSRRFAILTRDALEIIRSKTPDLYVKYIHSPTYDYFKGVQTECKFGVNHPNKDGFIELTIPDEATYAKYRACPEILAGIIIHEATHLFQAYNYINFHPGSCFEEFNKNRARSVQSANAHERQAFEVEELFFSKVYGDCNCQAALKLSWCWVNALSNDPSYPDLNRDNILNEKDFGKGMTQFHPLNYHANCSEAERKRLAGLIQQGKN